MPNDDSRPKKSWRDIDKMRDGSSGGGSRRNHEPRVSREDERQQKQYRAALEALFQKGEIGKLADKLQAGGGYPRTSNPPVAPTPPTVLEAAAPAPATAAPAAGDGAAAAKGGRKKPGDDKLTLRRKVLEAAGRHEISKAIEKYLERFPLPEDHEFLEQLLDHEKEARQQQALTGVKALLDDNIQPKRSRALCGKLRYIAETGDGDLKDQAAELLRRLGG